MFELMLPFTGIDSIIKARNFERAFPVVFTEGGTMEELKNEIITRITEATNYELLLIINRFIKRLLS